MSKQETNMTLDPDTEQKIRDIIKDEIQKGSRDLLKWRTYDSVTDQFSPITGASPQIGFFGTNKIAKPIVTGSKGGNAALTSLCAQLANLGLITNSTS